MDETSICVHQGGNKGNIFVDSSELPFQRVPSWKRRCCFTYIAMVCDNADVQRVLPQVFVGNAVSCKDADLPALLAACPPNAFLVRQRKAWNNVEVCRAVIRKLSEVLAPYRARFEPVLILDAAKVHCSRLVLEECNLSQIGYVLVPAHLTWLIQPLDTHGFRHFKGQLRKRYQDARVQTNGNDLSMEQFLDRCVFGAVQSLLENVQWATAFDRDGYGLAQAVVSARVKRDAGFVGLVQAPSSRPTVEDVGLCYPRRLRIPYESLWLRYQPPALPPPVAAAPAGGSAAPAMPASSSGSAASGAASSSSSHHASVVARLGDRAPRTRAEHRAVAAVAAASPAPPIASRPV